MNGVSNSQARTIHSLRRAQYLFTLLKMHMQRLRSSTNFEFIRSDLQFYESTLVKYTSKQLSSSTVLEIGYGQRPFRLIALTWIGANAFGIDLDEPIYHLTPARAFRLLRRNGATRAAKSIARRMVFDRSEYTKLVSVLGKNYGPGTPFDPNRLLSGDASKAETYNLVPRAIDFIFSDDVFEHIPADGISAILSMMSARMLPGAIAIISPMIFTGISGGHDLDWYPHRVGEDLGGRTLPWGHLVGDARPADTYLNRLRREDYRSLFTRDFDILEEVDLFSRLGEQFLTADVRERLRAYTEEDLFSNKVRFVLRRRR